MIGEPAQREHIEGPAVDAQRTGLSDTLAAPLQYDDLHFCQRQRAGEPQSDRTTATTPTSNSLLMIITPYTCALAAMFSGKPSLRWGVHHSPSNE
jgi:hypothetical protein